MSPLKQRLLEDRAMRNAARANVETDIAIIKGEDSDQGLTGRLLDGGKDLARTLSDGALDMAGDSKAKLGGAVALGVAGLAAWIFRGTIMDVIEGFFAEADEALAEDDASSEMEGEDTAEPDGSTGASDE